MSHQQSQTEAAAQPCSGPTLLAISSDGMGSGDEVLGKMLMRSHLHVLAEGPHRPGAIALFNSGVKLAAEGSLAVDDLASLADNGVKILLCGTCVGYFDLKDQVAVGEISNMHDITEAMLTAGKIINL